MFARPHISLALAGPWLLAGAAGAGIPDTPLPTFGDGKPARLAYLLPSVVKTPGLETVVICTSLAGQAINVGVEVFDAEGRLGNNVAGGNGADVGVAAGATVTFATGQIAVLEENRLITLNPPVTALQNGSARVVTAGGAVACVAYAIDPVHVIVDPLVDPAARPPFIQTLRVVNAVPCDPAACDDGNQCTIDSCDDLAGCLSFAALDGTPCDDGNLCTSGDVCTAGLCDGAGVLCGTDTPCNVTAVCVPATGQCEATSAHSTCVPGGGRARTDCIAEWVVDNPNNRRGVTNRVHVCNQGDATCDFDVDDKQCTFRVRHCLNNNDVNLTACTPGDVHSYRLAEPAARGARKAIVDAVLTAVGGLGTSSRGGRKQSVVTFLPALTTSDRCTGDIPLPVRRKKTLVLDVRARSSAGTKDRDELRLVCKVRRRPRSTAR